MLLNEIQRRLERLYSIQEFPPIEHFLIGTDEFKERYPHLRPAPQVLLQERKGELCLAVHLGDDQVQKIHEGGWSNMHLQDFASSIEEISHFVYLAFSASEEKEISLLDIEVQAEIDKYLMAMEYFPEEAGLFSRLFESIGYADGLKHDERERYEEANRLGAKLAKWIEKNHEEGRLSIDTLRFLRSFYRMASPKRLNKVEKIHGI